MLKHPMTALEFGRGSNPRKLGLMGIIVILAGLVFAVASRPVKSSQSDENSFLLLLNEGQMDISPKGITATDCMLVKPDGHFHLEIRRQQLPGNHATVRLFESSLASGQLQQLRNILDEERLLNLPPYVQPNFPINGHRFRGFRAQIARGQELQSIGYFVLPDEETSRTAPGYVPDNVKKAWRESQLALQPLQDWFHGVEGLKLIPTPDAKSTLCSLSPDVDD